MRYVVLAECKCNMFAPIRKDTINAGVSIMPTQYESLAQAVDYAQEMNNGHNATHFVELGHRWHVVPFDQITDDTLQINKDLLP